MKILLRDHSFLNCVSDQADWQAGNKGCHICVNEDAHLERHKRVNAYIATELRISCQYCQRKPHSAWTTKIADDFALEGTDNGT